MHMHKNGSSLTLAAGLALFACGKSDTFVANLNGANEAPSVSTTATGTATLTLDGSTMSYTINASGLTSNAAAAHLHVAASGVTGPIVVGFTGVPASTAPSATGSFTGADIVNPTNPPLSTPIATMDELVDAIRAGNVYVNVHTMNHAAGEIRGQLAAQ
jgi:hypothetical protein